LYAPGAFFSLDSIASTVRPDIGQAAKNTGHAIATQVGTAKHLIDEWDGDADQLLTARQLLLNGMKRAPGYAPTYVQLARVAFKSGYKSDHDYTAEALEQAQTYVSKALALDPMLGDAYVTGSYVLAFQHKLDSAKAKMVTANRLNANQIDLLNLQAFLANIEHKYDEAIIYANKVLTSTTVKYSLRQAYQELGKAYTEKKQYDQIEASHVARVNLYPNSAWEHANYSAFLTWREKYDMAIAHAETALNLKDFGVGHYTLAKAYRGKGDQLLWTSSDAQRALRYYALAVQQHPAYAEAHYGMGMACRAIAASTANSSLLDKCSVSIAKALKLNPSFPYAQIVLDKLPDFKVAINMPGRTADEHLKRGLVYLKATGYDEGMKDLNQAREMEPTRIEIYQQIDNVLSERREWDAVIGMWTKLIALQPKNGQAYYERGGASFHKGDMPTALKDLEQACKYNFGDSCQRLQRFAKQ
jgi:tetratricopeptide (TPR) repeat protein